MPYTKQNFIDGAVLTAENLNLMEEGIVSKQDTANLTTTLDDNADHTHYPSAKAVYDFASTGLMTPSEKTKLANIESGANKYIHPDSHPIEMITGLAAVAESGSYNDLTDKPSIPSVPTDISAFNNDKGYLTSYTESDPTVPEWAKATTKPTYTASEVGAVPTSTTVNGKALSANISLSASDVGALPNTTDIPSALSDLADDVAHRTVTDTEKATWNAKSTFSGRYEDLTGKPDIPSITGLATETYVDNKVAGIVDSSPEALNTLNELAAALGDDPNFATTVSNEIGKKADKTTTVNGHALSGNVTVSKSDVGLGNVPNVATNDQTPTFTEASTLENIVSGEKTSTLFGKIKKAITDLVAHLANKSNPHGVTKSQVGLGSVANTGDSATPVSGGTTKFTTGGAYTELAKKVDKVTGKGLSTNDYTTDEKNKLAGLATVATSGKYSDLIGTPTIPTVNNGTLTIQKNGTNVATFTANQSTGATANITVPTKVSELTNDSGFKTTDNNTTYDLAASKSSTNGNVKINLTAGGSGSGTDSVTIKGANGTSVTTDANGVVTVSSATLATVATSGSYNDLSDKPAIPAAVTVDTALSSTSTNPVQNKVVNTALNARLEKTTYEKSAELACGSNGKVCLGKFGAYDTNITIELNSTTSTTYHATIVIHSQNVVANGTGGTVGCYVYGDADNHITPLITVFRPYGSANRQIEVYANLSGWSKNLVHVQGVALSDGGMTDILTSVSEIPTSISGKTKVTPVNVLTTNFAPKSHSHNDYQTKTDNALTTTDKTIAGAINEVNTNTIDKIYSIDAWHGTKGSLKVNDSTGITWEDGVAFFDDGDNVLHEALISLRVPIVAGNNISFETDEDKQMVKVHANGLPSCTTSNNGQFLRVVDGVPAWSTISNAEDNTF